MYAPFRTLIAGLLVLAAVQTSDPRAGAQPAGPQPRAVPGEVIVKFKHQAGPADRARARGRVAAAAAAALVRSAAGRQLGEVELLRVSAPSVQAAAALLRSDPAVEYAEPNWIYTHAAPNDPSLADQWALDNRGQRVSGYTGTPDADIDAVEAWSTVGRATGVYVGVLDEGIDWTHPDLGAGPGGPVWTNPFDPVDGRDNDGNGYVDDVRGWDFAGNDNTVYDGSALDPEVDAHGTHVAGTLGARTNNGAGIAGVSPGVIMIPAKFLAPGGGTTANAIRALDYLTDLKLRHGLNIVATNNSWSGGGFSQALLDAIGRAARADILFIAASGNGGADAIADNSDNVPVYPSGYDTTGVAGYDAVLAVTATDSRDALPPWANYGLRSVDLAAPGSLVLSTTPRNAYSFSSGTSMAVPHVTGAAVLVHAARGLTGYALREALLSSVDLVPALNGRALTGGRLNAARAVSPFAAPPATPDGGTMAEIVLRASGAQTRAGNWNVVSDTTAAGGARLQSLNRGAPKIATALANPVDYFDLTFEAAAGRPYRLWLRGRADGNSWANDSVHVQFDGAVDGAGRAFARIGSATSTEVNVEACGGCGLAGWGWQDNGYGAGVLGPVIYFARSGVQRLRVQIREDGIGIDQIVLSSARYLNAAPGAAKNDRTILADMDTSSSGEAREVVMYAAEAGVLSGAWTRVSDASAAGGRRLQHADAGAPKIAQALAAPLHYFELTFQADAGRPYRLWLRGKAQGNAWSNDSVHVQFGGSVDASGAAVYRIGTTSAAEVNLEDCSGCGLSGWGWQDNGYGAGVLGPEIRFAATGTQRMRIQVREDGFGIDQIVLSPAHYLTASPGRTKSDTTILPKQ